MDVENFKGLLRAREAEAGIKPRTSLQNCTPSITEFGALSKLTSLPVLAMTNDTCAGYNRVSIVKRGGLRPNF